MENQTNIDQEFYYNHAGALAYNDTLTPIENIKNFYNRVNPMQYVMKEHLIQEKTAYYLDSYWQNEAGLIEITRDFEVAFMDSLVRNSMNEENGDYEELLIKCKNALQLYCLSFGSPVGNLRILQKGTTGDAPNVIAFETLEKKEQEMISNCHILLQAFFVNLKKVVLDEINEIEQLSYVRKSSNYEWINDKIDLSELAAALFYSGAIKVKGHQKFMPSTFARDLAAFFNIQKLDYDQNIVALRSKSGEKNPSRFIDSMKTKYIKFLKEKVD